MSSASTSTVSLASTATVSSRAPLNSSNTVKQPKDYQAAFGNLQSTYGMNGSAPIPVQKKRASPPASLAKQDQPPTKKDFSSAFGDLQSTYGFAGAIPSPVPKPKSRPERSENASFASRFGGFRRWLTEPSSSRKQNVQEVPRSS
ncbi:hypothetical protein R3P38DRAFT_2924369 [Favolaschia claudopus]|uniref:Uncharacterized protein n=1 Tax=Favolaschia claudopus TaxID=2862362 RepID=A0AAW0BXE7_9AGAR